MTLRTTVLCLVLVSSWPVHLFAQEPQTAPPVAATQTGGAVVPPSVLSTSEPSFSVEERRQKLKTTVIVETTIDPQGIPTKVHVKRSAAVGLKDKNKSAAQSLDAKAVAAVEQYRFKPAMRDGHPISVQMYVEVNFDIH